MNDALAKTTKPPSFGGGLKKGIAAQRAAYDKKMAEIDPKTVENRLCIVMDDSGSMGHHGMEDAHKAIKGFTDSCNYQDTSIAIYPLNATEKQLICDYDVLNIYAGSIWSTGGTPIYGILDKVITNEDVKRVILFSDGDPTDSSILKHPKEKEEDDVTNTFHYSYGQDDGTLAHKVVDKYEKKELPIDTIAIGKDSDELKKLSEITKGTYIRFQDTLSLSTGLKYLSPKFRALLANPEIKARIEKGEKI